MRFSCIALLAAAGVTLAQRPSNTSICDYYTTALLKNNTAANQYKLLTLVVNTAVIGNYTTPNVGIMVPGILTNGTYNGTAVSLAGYFNGKLASSNRGGNSGVAVNFLDDGGAAPLMMNMPANGTSSNQYKLLTHLYQFFGTLLGCSMQGMPGFSAYGGQASMYSVHKFMDLNPYQVQYFITQVGLSAASFGVSVADVTAVGESLAMLFDYRCSPPSTAIPAQGPQLQSVCIDPTCPLAANANCSLETNNGAAMMPSPANSTNMSNGTSTSSSSSSMSGTSTSTSTSTGSSSPAPSAKSGANALSAGSMLALIGSVLALVL